MDLQEQSALELANHVAARVKARARPWRAIIALIVALGAAGTAAWASADLHRVIGHDHLVSRVVWISGVAGFCLFGIAAVVGLAAKSREVLQPRTGSAHAAVVRYTVLLTGGIAALIGTLALLKIPIGQLIVGGALTTILIGIAAQQSLGNVFAGIVLLLSRPFLPGDSIVIRSGALNGPIEGTVTEIGLTYVRLDTGDGVIHLPNSQVLAAGVGHVRPAISGPPEPQDPARAGPQLPPPAPPAL